MISKRPSFQTDDGSVFKTIEEAQEKELSLLFNILPSNTDADGPEAMRGRLIKQILLNSAKIVDILTTTATSIPKARKANGGSKPRKAKQVPTYPIAGEP